ncbi:protein NO VEIN domain-containing protein [Nocardioides ultimimeridianus]
MPIQPEPILRAAARWLERIPSSGVARARSILVTNRRFADLTPTQYETALDWLQRVDLLGSATETWRTPAEAVFEAAVTEAVWFRDLDLLVTSPEELPADAVTAAGALGLSEQEGYRLAGRRWGKVETAERERIGAIGEELLVELLRRSIAGSVEHISLVTDSAGYDLLIRTARGEVHLEVKTSKRRNRTTFHVSRNEYEVMRSDPCWRLAHLALDEYEEIEDIRSIDRAFIAGSAPLDAGIHARWQSCSMDAPPERSAKGVPELEHALLPSAPTVLRPSIT